MNIANALRALLAVAESAHEYLMSDGSVAADDVGAQQAKATIANASAALAAHDAAVQAGGWSVSRDAWPRIIGEDGESVIAKTYTQDGTHADRIVACVNACQGIADPARLVPVLWNLVASARHTGVAIDPEAIAEALS